MFNKLAFVLFIALFVSLCGKAFGQNISVEARRYFDRGMAAVEMAKSAEDFDVAIREFKQATALAPDWADAYYNLGKVQESAEKYTDAIASFRRYLQLAPAASDAEEVKSLINKLGFKADQVLTIPEVIDVLVSFTKAGWNLTDGECRTANLLIKHGNLPPTAADSVSVGQILGGNYDKYTYPYGVSWQPPKKIQGPIFKYGVQHDAQDICGGNPNIAGNWVMCPHMEVEIQVVSRTYVKVRQKIVKLYGVDSPYVGKTYLCEYRKDVSGRSIATDPSVNVKDASGRTPLQNAVLKDNLENIILGKNDEVARLIARGAEVDGRDSYQATALHYAAVYGLTKDAGILIASGADVNARNRFGQTPLHKAAQEGKSEVAELMLAKGANVNAKDNFGRTPLQYADDANHKEMVELLKRYGAK